MKSRSKADSIKVCGVTTSRADFGILKSLFRELENDKRFQFQLVIGGPHLERKFSAGLTEIQQEGFSFVQKMGDESGESKSDNAHVIAETIASFSSYLDAQEPDVVLCLGDRYELLGFAIPAFLSSTKLFHLHGGEKTVGSFDDSIRHAITKLSDLHLTAHQSYANRIAQLGEEKERIFVVGALGAAPISQDELWAISSLEDRLGAKLLSHNLLVTFHPETRSPDGGLSVLSDLLAAIPVDAGIRIVFTDTNGDPHSDRIVKLVDKFIANTKGLAISVTSLGREGYHSCLAHFDAVLGNSSSGVIEAASYGIPVVNIGTRQQGRYMPANVIDVPAGKEEIRAAIQLALSPNFRNLAANAANPFHREDQDSAIAQLIFENYSISKRKSFVDLQQRPEFQ